MAKEVGEDLLEHLLHHLKEEKVVWWAVEGLAVPGLVGPQESLHLVELPGLVGQQLYLQVVG